MKKAISLLGAKVLAVMSANVAFVWIIIEFILYLAKDKVFNWWSVWSFVISVVVAIAVVIILAVWQVKEQNMIKQKRDKIPKSRFQQRLEKMEQKRANT